VPLLFGRARVPPGSRILGPLRQIAFVGTQDGADAYEVSFRNGAAIRFIRMSRAGRIAGLFITGS
jgi:hypothetical protein